MVIATAFSACAEGAPTAGDERPGGTRPPESSAPPTPTLREDKQAIRAALLTPADLGKPWIEPETINEVVGPEEERGLRCDNFSAVLEAAPARRGVEAERNLTEGRQAGAAILKIRATTIDDDAVDAWRTAQEKSLAPCSRPESRPTYAVLEPIPAPAVGNAEESFGAITRIYADRARTTLLYVRHIVVSRTGRAVVYLQHAFVQPRRDPDGSDTTVVVELMEKQLHKVQVEMGEFVGPTP